MDENQQVLLWWDFFLSLHQFHHHGFAEHDFQSIKKAKYMKIKLQVIYDKLPFQTVYFPKKLLDEEKQIQA